MLRSSILSASGLVLASHEFADGDFEKSLLWNRDPPACAESLDLLVSLILFHRITVRSPWAASAGFAFWLGI